MWCNGVGIAPDNSAFVLRVGELEEGDRRVARQERTRRFYKDVLGMPLVATSTRTLAHAGPRVNQPRS
jgi:hypothetical protein